MNATIVSPFVESICKELGLSSDQRLKLAVYPDNVLSIGYSKVKNTKLNDKFHAFNLLNKIAKTEFDKTNQQSNGNSGYTATSSSFSDNKKEKTNAPWLPARPNPWEHKSKEENLNRWTSYESTPEVKAYRKHFGDERIDKQKGDYLGLLSKQNNPTQSVVTEEPKSKVDFFSPMTAMEIAQEIRMLHPQPNEHPIALLHGMPSRIIANYSDKPYVPTNDEAEQIALMFIDRYRVRYGFMPRVLLDLKPELPESVVVVNEPPVTLQPVDYSKDIEGELTPLTVAANIISAKKNNDDAKINWLLDQEYVLANTKGESATISFIDRVKKERGWVKKDAGNANQPKTQEIKKDSTNSNVDQIQDWLSIVTYGQDKKVLAVVDGLPDYNPFDELEDLDSPLQL